MRITDKYCFFYGSVFSNWYPARFKLNGIYFWTSEQAFMWFKAMNHGDYRIASMLEDCENPELAKRLGKQITNYDDELWSSIRYQIMIKVLIEKFEQNEEMKKFLLDHAHLELAEASPYDIIWGIGLAEHDDRVLTKELWQGENLLGKALNEVANAII